MLALIGFVAASEWPDIDRFPNDCKVRVQRTDGRLDVQTRDCDHQAIEAWAEERYGRRGPRTPVNRVIAPPGEAADEDEPGRIHWSEIKVLSNRPQPKMPALAKELTVTSDCSVDIYVGTDGKVDRVAFAECPGMFQDSAAEAVTAWRFEPPDEPVHFRINLRYQLR